MTRQERLAIEIEQHRQEFLARGGKIQIIPPDVTTAPPKLNKKQWKKDADEPIEIPLDAVDPFEIGSTQIDGNLSEG